MHGNRDPNEGSTRYLLFVKFFNRDVHRGGLKTCSFQKAQWQSDAKRLMAKLVAGNQKYGSW
jgi:hypothetical protein